MEWSGQKSFVNSPEVPFEVDGSEAGVLKTQGPLSFLKVRLTFLKTSYVCSLHTSILYNELLVKLSCVLYEQVHDAGHMVPMDQPKAALEMLKRWMEGSLSKVTTEQESLVASI